MVSGTIWARVGDREIQAPAGTYIWKPRQVMHTFWNPGPEPALIVETISPGGFERLFEQVAALLVEQEPGPSTDQDAIVLCNQYGLAGPYGAARIAGTLRADANGVALASAATGERNAGQKPGLLRCHRVDFNNDA